MNPVKNIDEQTTEEGFDFKSILFLLIRQWQWFLLFAAIGFAGAYIYTKMTKSMYTVTASVLIPEKTNGLDMKGIFQGVGMDEPKNNIYNQIEIITSYPPINQTLLTLQWNTSWFRKDLFVWEGI